MLTTTSTTTRKYQDTTVDVKLVLSALWVTMLMVFAYVDIFGFYRADVLQAALDGTVGTTGLPVNQAFLTATLVYILLPSLMVALSLVLKPRVNRILNIFLSLLYVVTIVVSCIGESWVYYLLGSAVEVVLLLAIARTAWTWPAPGEHSLQSR
ncbi:hypothetical protein BH23ACT6_BH23ACT6_04650 [soil metagenome]